MWQPSYSTTNTALVTTQDATELKVGGTYTFSADHPKPGTPMDLHVISEDYYTASAARGGGVLHSVAAEADGKRLRATFTVKPAWKGQSVRVGFAEHNAVHHSEPKSVSAAVSPTVYKID